MDTKQHKSSEHRLSPHHDGDRPAPLLPKVDRQSAPFAAILYTGLHYMSPGSGNGGIAAVRLFFSSGLLMSKYNSCGGETVERGRKRLCLSQTRTASKELSAASIRDRPPSNFEIPYNKHGILDRRASNCLSLLMSQQPPEKAYTPPGVAPPQGQPEYPQGQQPPMTQYDRPPYSQAQLHSPSPQYQLPSTRQYTPPPQSQGPPQGQYQPYPQVQHVQHPNVQQQQQQQQQQPAAQYAYAPPQMVSYPQQPQQQQPYHPAPFVQHQPVPVVGMTTTGTSGNRNVRNLPRDARGRREWSFDLCNCFDDCGTCVLGCWCPCMLYAQLKQRIDYLNAYGTPDPNRGGSGVNLNCMVWCALHVTTGCGCLLQAINRGNIRNRYMIEGDGFADFCTAGWCPACELTQEHRELDQEERSLMK
ncbi:hypothetical protein APHAL10511_003304 [Amanita phalloides]|nr:hypothetical protein APHAL10511_003304 [Amanita phalloides]